MPKSSREIWQKYDRMERRLTRPLTDRILELAAVLPGMQVLDIGTGRGEPAVPAAQRVAPTGTVLGIDVSWWAPQKLGQRDHNFPGAKNGLDLTHSLGQRSL